MSKAGGIRNHALLLLVWVVLLALFFAMVEIQIEGTQGWASALPTWRIEKHWLLGMPTDYLVFTAMGGILLTWSFKGGTDQKK